MNDPLSILYEDNHLLVVEKPTGIATVGVRESEVSLAKIAKDYLKKKYAKPGNVFLGVVSRLDSLVSGVIVLARTSKSAARLSEQFRTSQVLKRYWAIVAGHVEPEQGILVHWLTKDEAAKRVRAVPGDMTLSPRSIAQRAELSYREIGTAPGKTLLEIEPRSGRKHQIRVQLAESGWPILGDKKYGSRQPFFAGIALHSIALRILHPVRLTPLTFRSPPPEGWRIGQFQVDFENQTRNLK